MKPILIVSLVKDGRPEAVEAVPEPAEDAPSDSDLLAEAADAVSYTHLGSGLREGL